jgi:hypothetical protein
MLQGWDEIGRVKGVAPQNATADTYFGQGGTQLTMGGMK